MERYIDKFKRECPLKDGESAADYAERFMDWMVHEKGAYYPGCEAAACQSLQQRGLKAQLDAMQAYSKIAKHTTSSDTFICQAATGALNGLLANPGEETSLMTDGNLVVKAVNLAEKLYEELHEKQHI